MEANKEAENDWSHVSSQSPRKGMPRNEFPPSSNVEAVTQLDTWL
jgi:hypothetical protein